MKIAEIGAFKCGLPECSIETTGKCVNALDIEDCPNKIGVIESVSSGQEPEQTMPEARTTVRLPWGVKFSEDNLADITYRYPCTMVLLIGEPSCGKSTLYAAIFDSFHKGAIGEYMFAGTRTPLAFEELCHLAREKSKGKKSDTERTKSYEFVYYHLAARKSDLSEVKKHLLFADVNGEKYQAAKLKDEEIIKLGILKKADHLFFIADGSLLCDNKQKHIVKKDIWNMLSRCLQNGMISKTQNVNLIVTKWDAVHEKNKARDITDFFIDETLKKFPSVITSTLKIASRSLNEHVPPRTGIDDFLKICLANPVQRAESLYQPDITREFQRFKFTINE